MAWFFFPRLISAFIAILVLVVLSRVLAPADFGQYNIIILFGTVSYSFVLAWLAIAITRFHSSEKYGGRVIAYALHTSAKIVVFLLPVVILLCFLVPAKLVTAFVMGALICVAHATQELGLAALRVYHKGPAFAFVTLVRPLVGVSLSVSLVLMGFGLVGAIIGAIVGALFAGGIALYQVFTRSGAEPAEWLQIKEFFIFGMPLGIVTSGSMLIVLLSQSFLATFVDSAAVGIFAAAQTLAMRSIAMPMVMVSRASAASIFSEYEESGIGAANAFLKLHFSYLLLMSAPIATVLVFANETAAFVMFGEAYWQETSRHLPILAIAAFITGLQGAYFAFAFTLSEKTYTQLYILAGATAVHAGTTAIAIQLLGSMGASYAMLTTAILSSLAYYFLGKRAFTQIQLPMRPIWKVLIASAAMAPFAAYADSQSSTTVAFGAITLGSLVFVAALIALRQTGMLAILEIFRHALVARRAKNADQTGR